MVSFTVDNLFVLDLRDDFIMNDKLKLYQFVDKDPVKAFHLGIHISKWFDLLDKKQQYLHSKSIRHNQEDIESYREQMRYWAQKFPCASEDEQINVIELSEYIFNNLIWNDSTEEEDRIKIALFLGMVANKNAEVSEEDLVFNIH